MLGDHYTERGDVSHSLKVDRGCPGQPRNPLVFYNSPAATHSMATWTKRCRPSRRPSASAIATSNGSPRTLTSASYATPALPSHQEQDPEDEGPGRVNVTVHGRARRFRTVTFDVRRNAVRLIEHGFFLTNSGSLPQRTSVRRRAPITDMVVRGAGRSAPPPPMDCTGARAFRGRAWKRSSGMFRLLPTHSRRRGQPP